MHRFTIVITTLIVLAVAGVAVFVWPTFYRYDNVSGHRFGYLYMIKTNRFTGTSYGLTRTGWHEIAAPKRPQKVEAPAAPEALSGTREEGRERYIDVTDEYLRDIAEREGSREIQRVEAPAPPERK